MSQYEAMQARAERIAGDPGARSRMVVVPFTAAMEPVFDLDLDPFPGLILDPVA